MLETKEIYSWKLYSQREKERNSKLSFTKNKIKTGKYVVFYFKLGKVIRYRVIKITDSCIIKPNRYSYKYEYMTLAWIDEYDTLSESLINLLSQKITPQT